MADCGGGRAGEFNNMSTALKQLLDCPVIAILRGVTPDEVLAVGKVLIDAGFKVIEVPLNSPSAFASIEMLASRFGADVVVGAGTVLSVTDVDGSVSAGANLILAPNRNIAVIERAVHHGVVSMPGVATPSEGFEALAAGAHALKLFPSDVLGPATVKAWRAVFPKSTPMFCVGGIGVENMGAFRNAGANGVGLGSSLYAPGVSLTTLAVRARSLLAAWPGR
jgi:2-dehydro-3-deoxyphosphogalactonate aldolase